MHRSQNTFWVLKSGSEENYVMADSMPAAWSLAMQLTGELLALQSSSATCLFLKGVTSGTEFRLFAPSVFVAEGGAS